MTQDLPLKERYRLVKPIAQGRFGRTFLAVDEAQSPASPCAIEQLQPQEQTPAALTKCAELFYRSAQRLEKLGKHPQIPAVLDYFTAAGNFYLVQEFIDGSNLAEAVESEGVFKESQIWQLLDELLPILQFIHSQQVIHGDIKPQNIIRRSSDDRFILVDFSAAEAVNIGTSSGSAEYAAPEQAQGKAIFASDLYSLGVTCIYLLTGISPFNLFDVGNNCWVWRQYLTDNVSDRLSYILDKLLQNTVNLRFQSADEVMQTIGIQFKIPNPKSPIENPAWRCIHTLTGHSGSSACVNAVAIGPDGKIIASGGDDKTVKLWNLETGELIFSLSGHSHFVKCVAFSPDGSILATGSDDRTIKLWHVSTGKEIATLTGHSHAVKSLAFSPSHLTSGTPALLASASWDKTIKLWDINSKQAICTLVGHQLQVTAVAFNPYNATGGTPVLLASTSFDRTVRLWDLTSVDRSEFCPQLRYTLAGHSWPVFTAAFSPQGNLLATGSDDKTVKLWDLKTGREIRTLAGHSWTVVALAFSPDGEMLFSASWDKTVKIWRVSSGEEIATLAQHSDSVSALAISPYGNILASGSKDKTIKIWQLVGKF
ncbi:serine/threonine-protein kinase [Aerosakkonema funiforme]|uniref:serine/threonine-protein kinase n=1 Tax=Oscillatoriophycideae TaxID=1301283 RepID=UPI002AC85C9B|nr:serine/threonine-protein kinase [Aerosakkonema funiforme]